MSKSTARDALGLVVSLGFFALVVVLLNSDLFRTLEAWVTVLQAIAALAVSIVALLLFASMALSAALLWLWRRLRSTRQEGAACD